MVRGDLGQCAAGTHRLVDLAWVRLRPWRQLVAGLFTTGKFAAFLPAVRQVQVEGAGCERALLAGWLASRLRLPPDRIELLDATAVSVRIHAHLHGVPALFLVETAHDLAEIRAAAQVTGGPSHRRRLPVPRWSITDQLDLAVSRPPSDPEIYHHALDISAASGYWP